MANIELLIPKILQWEGGYVNDPADSGGATNMGVTLNTWRKMGYDKDADGDIDAEDMKLLKQSDFQIVFKRYWDICKADSIENQSLAELVVYWFWGSGYTGIKEMQRALGLVPDGKIGPKTLAKLNSDPKNNHALICGAMIKFIYLICEKNPKNLRFKKGWLNRLRTYQYSD